MPGSFRSTASIIRCSVSTSITSENGLRISRVFERICSSRPDSSGTAEKITTGVGGGMERTTSRPEPWRSRRSMTAPLMRLSRSRCWAASAVSAEIDVEAVQRQEFLERFADAEVVFDDENQRARHCDGARALELRVKRSYTPRVACALLERMRAQDSCSIIRKNPSDRVASLGHGKPAESV